MTALQTAFVWLDYAAVAVFAVSGALAAARKRHDIITFGFFAAITGVGGGTLRDLLIGAPVFWVQRPGYVIVCLVAAVLVWFPRRPAAGAFARFCGSMRWAWPPIPSSAPPRRCRSASIRFRRW